MLKLLQEMEAMFYTAELACHTGAFLSLVIATKLFRMEDLTFFNKMFLVYFLIDFVIGNMETYIHFKLWMDRYLDFRNEKVPLI